MAALGLVLLCGAVVHSYVGRQCVPNSVCIGIAGLAPLYAVGENGWTGLSDFAWRLVVAALFAAPLALLFVVRTLEGSEVLLLIVLWLWIPTEDIPAMLAITVLAGVAMGIGVWLLSSVFCFMKIKTAPYGVALVVGALCVMLPRFGGLATAVCRPLA